MRGFCPPSGERLLDDVLAVAEIDLHVVDGLEEFQDSFSMFWR